MSSKAAKPVRRAGRSAILVHGVRQKQNPVLAHLQSLNVAYELDSSIEPDFVTGATSCVLYLQLQYHRIRPEYIEQRFNRLGRDFDLRILMVMIDSEDKNYDDAMRELTVLTFNRDYTIIVVRSDREAAMYLRNLKQFETASPRMIQGQAKETYEEQLVAVCASVRGVNKSNAASLVSTFGSFKEGVVKGSAEDGQQLENIPGWGSVKARGFHRAVTEPFKANKTYAMAPRGAEKTNSLQFLAKRQQSNGDPTATTN
ncbi:hypothetical protein TRVA0_001S01024 [Trichomonascus vanleenenianus]|uniref:DNA repair protein RAD10 n=1 Tax=Trichomonascus vanleenenianus TaxID=2268995 RepID=UPI003ECA65DE